MNTVLPDGYRVLPEVLTDADTDALREAIGETIDRVARALRTPYATSHPDAALEERLERIAQHDRTYAYALLQVVFADAQRDPRLEALARHPRLSAEVASLLRPSPIADHVIRARAVVPAFSTDRTAWHQDTTRTPEELAGGAAVRVACWMPLTDVGETTGALEVMPGDWSAPLPHRASPDGRFSIPDESLPAGPRVVVPLRRGDVLLLDRYIPHRSLPVRDGRVRWAVAMWVKIGAGGSTC